MQNAHNFERVSDGGERGDGFPEVELHYIGLYVGFDLFSLIIKFVLLLFIKSIPLFFIKYGLTYFT